MSSLSHRTLLSLAIAWLIASAAGRMATGVTFGLQGDYFLDDRPTSAAPTRSVVDRSITTAQLTANWVGDPPTAFRTRWFGYLSAPAADTYTFALESDDGATLAIDGRQVVDNGGVHGPATASGTVNLSAGAHAVLLEYEQAGGGYAVRWRWARGRGPLADVPPWVLSPRRAGGWRLSLAHRLEQAVRTAAIAVLALCVWWLVGRRSRVARAIASAPRAAALVLFILFTVVETWPLATHPGRLSRNDNGDTILNEWIISWVARHAAVAPLSLYDANIFHPERRTLAYSETMLVQSAMAAPVLWLGGSPVLAYNLVLMAGFALSGWTMALVLVRWTGHWAAAVTGGAIFAFNAHSLTRLPHLQAQHVEFLPLALFALDRLLITPGPRQAIGLAGWFVLQALTSVYLLVFSAVAVVAAALSRPRDWRTAGFLRLATWSVVAALVAALLLAPFLLPYWRVYSELGLTRTLADAGRFAAGWHAYLATPARLHFAAWSSRFFESVALFPGVVALALTAVAIARGIAWRDARARMCLAVALVGLYLSFGDQTPGYATLYRAVPLLHAVRDVSRFGSLVIVGVAVLAAYGLADLASHIAPRRAGWLALCPLLVILETTPAPVWYARFDGISSIYDRLQSEPAAVVAEFPFYRPGAEFRHAAYMLNSTRHWRPMINGYSGFQPLSFHANVEALYRFPDGPWLGALRAQGVTHVFVHAREYPRTVLERLDAWPGIAKIAEQDGILLYTVER